MLRAILVLAVVGIYLANRKLDQQLDDWWLYEFD